MAAFSVGFVTVAMTALKLYTFNVEKNAGQNENCAEHDKRLAMIESEMQQRVKNAEHLFSQLNALRTEIHNDFSKVWKSMDNLKDLLIKKLPGA